MHGQPTATIPINGSKRAQPELIGLNGASDTCTVGEEGALPQWCDWTHGRGTHSRHTQAHHSGRPALIGIAGHVLECTPPQSSQTIPPSLSVQPLCSLLAWHPTNGIQSGLVSCPFPTKNEMGSQPKGNLPPHAVFQGWLNCLSIGCWSGLLVGKSTGVRVEEHASPLWDPLAHCGSLANQGRK